MQPKYIAMAAALLAVSQQLHKTADVYGKLDSQDADYRNLQNTVDQALALADDPDVTGPTVVNQVTEVMTVDQVDQVGARISAAVVAAMASAAPAAPAATTEPAAPADTATTTEPATA